MKIVLKGFGALVGVILVGLLVVTVYARFHDGPVAAFAGGPLVTGDWIESQDIDWSFVADLDTIEFQLIEPPRSRTVWILHHEGKLFIPCGLPNFTLWKQWPHEALADGRAVLRVDGKRYAVNLVKTDDPGERSAVMSLLETKYATSPPDDGSLDDMVWVFRIESREHV